ncbi:hypothetical protein F4780DRAFT_740964 [Xylariomycetidae sp. FL0641]|nr:hypothetical protein F4780DRAFT_740964 [Xylariomycetidae sp. FL0641]
MKQCACLLLALPLLAIQHLRLSHLCRAPDDLHAKHRRRSYCSETSFTSKSLPTLASSSFVFLLGPVSLVGLHAIDVIWPESVVNWKKSQTPGGLFEVGDADRPVQAEGSY